MKLVGYNLMFCTIAKFVNVVLQTVFHCEGMVSACNTSYDFLCEGTKTLWYSGIEENA